MSATCRAKGGYANRKHELAKAQQLPSITEQLARSEERVKQPEAQLEDQKEENEALRATIQQLATQPTPSRYHIDDAGSADVEARSSPKLALEPQQRAEAAPLARAGWQARPSPREARWRLPRLVRQPRTPEGQPRALAEALATLTTPGADSSIKKL